MNRIVNRALALLLAVLLTVGAMPLYAFSLTAKEMEDIHRVRKLWQDEYNKMYISWLLKSDNFVYHLDVTRGNIVDDPNFIYSSLNLNYFERKENFKSILLSMIDYTNASMNAISQKNLTRKATSEYFDWFKNLVNDTSFIAEGAGVELIEAINLTSKEYLDFFIYDPNIGDVQLSYAEMFKKICEKVNDPAARKEAESALGALIESDEWLKHSKSFSTSLNLINAGVDLASNCLDAIIEAESCRITNEKYVELLAYVRANTSDPALKEACNEVLTRLSQSYEANLVDCVLEGVRDTAIESFGLPALKEIISSSSLTARVSIFAYDSGKLVSEWLFNADDLKKYMQSIYATNEISEILVPLLSKEIKRSYGYINYSEATARYAESTIYHMRMLICLRRIGEESYYRLKDSAYSARLVEALAGLNWKDYTEDIERIEKWHDDLNYAFSGIEVSLFGNILAHNYYDEALKTRDDFEILSTRLERYIGNEKIVYVTGSDIRTIGEYAFSDCESLEEVYIGSCVDMIEAYAFSGCTNLKKVTIENKSAVIDENAFSGISDLTIYAYSGSTAESFAKTYGYNFDIIENPYADAMDYEYDDFTIRDGMIWKYKGDGGVVYIPYGVESIGSEAFKDCTTVTDVIIPNTVHTIYSRAFWGCTELADIVIPDNVTTVGMNAFGGYKIDKERTITVGKGVTSGIREIFAIPLGNNYVSIKVSEDNPVYRSEGNCIIERATGKIILGCNTSIIPTEGVNSIGDFAFCGSGIKNIDIPSNITSIGESAFQYTKLEKITLGKSINYIGTGAFASCPLNEIYYDVKALSVGSDTSIFSQVGRVDSTVRITIGDNATEIPDRCFLNLKGEVVLSFSANSQCKAIGSYAFAHCKIEQMSLPTALEVVYEYAFSNVQIDKVSYHGSCIEWSSIDFKEGNDALLSLTPEGLSHIGEWKVTEEATCINHGTMERTCEACSAQEKKSYADSGAHNFDTEFTIDREATCTVDGEMSRHCKNCDERCDVTSIPKLVPSSPEADFEYNITDGKVTVTKYTGTSPLMSIPSEIEGLPVVAISSFAFYGNTVIEEVLLPFSLDSVGYAAFDGCVALERVYFSGTKEQWREIDIDVENTELDGAEILCIDSLGFSDVYMEPEESIALKYRVDASNIECFGCENLRAVFELDGQEYTVDNYEKKDGYYVFTFSEISPEKLGDTVIATLAYTIADREHYSSPIGYRASEYCYSALRDGTADLYLKKVLVNLLNYCSEAQDYTDHSTDRLVNADLTTDEMLLAAQDNPVASSIKNEKYLTVTSPEASFTSARLLLKDSAQLILCFKMSDISGAKIEISSSLGKWVIDSQSFLYDGVNYYVCCDALSVADVSEELYVTVYKGGTAVSNTLSYSVESYVYSIASTDEKIAPLLDALMRYGSSAKEYSRLG